MTISEPYIRKKGNKFIIERKVDARTEYLKTLNIKELMRYYFGVDASRFYEEATQGKEIKASQETKRPNIEEDNVSSLIPKVRLPDIVRTPEKDALPTEKRTVTEEESRMLWEITRE